MFSSFGVGPYYPELDGSRRARFEQTFGEARRPLFTIELDRTLAPLGPGHIALDFGVGYSRFSKRHYRVDASGKPVRDKKGERLHDDGSYNVLPLTLGVGFIADKVAEASSVPLVPFAKAGAAHVMGWKSGDASVTQSAGVPSRGSATGTFWALGVGLCLSDPATDFALYDTAGVSRTHLFVAWRSYELRWFRQRPNLSDRSWVVGLSLRN